MKAQSDEQSNELIDIRAQRHTNENGMQRDAELEEVGADFVSLRLVMKSHAVLMPGCFAHLGPWDSDLHFIFAMRDVCLIDIGGRNGGYRFDWVVLLMSEELDQLHGQGSNHGEETGVSTINIPRIW